VFTVDEDYTNAHTDRFTLEWQQEVMANTSVTLGATYAKAADLEYITDANLQYACADGTVGFDCEPALGTNGMPKYSTTKPYPYYGRISVIASGAESEYMGFGGDPARGQLLRLPVGHLREGQGPRLHERNAGLNLSDKRPRGQLKLLEPRPEGDRGQRHLERLLGHRPLRDVQVRDRDPYTAYTNSDFNADGDRFTDRPTIDGVHLDRTASGTTTSGRSTFT
jgi:hypothetical protein